MDGTKVFAYVGSVLVGVGMALAFIGGARAQGGGSPLSLAVIGADGNPVAIDQLGCADSDGPEYPHVQDAYCTNCSAYTCTFETTRPGLGGYVETTYLDYTETLPITNVWQVEYGGQVAVLWGDAPWTSTRYITFTLSITATATPTPTPTPTPTSTPTPTPTPTATPTPFPTATPFYAEAGGARALFLPTMTPIPTLPNEGIYQNSSEVSIAKLGGPLIRQPQGFGALAVQPELSLPDVTLPDINPSEEWPELSTGRDGVLSQIHTQIQTVQTTLDGQYSWARARIASFEQTTAALRDFIGSPQSVVASDGARQVTVTGMAQEMAQSVAFALGYLRAVGALGPMGLDVVFVFIGLAWMLFVNLMEWLTRAIAWFVRLILRVAGWIVELVRVLLEIVRTIMALIPFF